MSLGSQTAALVKKLRPKPRKEPIVRFEGLPGEYAQFDFGECIVPFVATGKDASGEAAAGDGWGDVAAAPIKGCRSAYSYAPYSRTTRRCTQS